MARKKRASKWNIHVRNVMRAMGGGPRAMKVASRTFNKSSQRPAANWREVARRAAKGGGFGGKKGRKSGRRKGRRGGRNLDSFSGLDAFLSRLLGGVKKVLKPRLRPSESLAERKAKLQELIGKMDKGIDALKEREKFEDMNRAQYQAHLAELRRLQAAQNALKKAWREAHKKQKKEGGAWTGPGDWGGFMSSGDPGRRRRKGGKRKSKKRPSKSGSKKRRSSGRRRVSAATRAKMSRAAKRRWAAYRAKHKGKKGRGRKGLRGKKRGKKRARRDWSGDFGSF